MKKILLKNWRPIFIENSKIPVWLSKIAPLNIGAISFGFWVLSRGKLNETTKRHETIHFQQQLELLFIFQWILYGVFWLIGIIKYRNNWQAINPRGALSFPDKDKKVYKVIDNVITRIKQKSTRAKYTSAGNKAYYRNPAEQEAYDNQDNVDYLQKRKRWRWLWKYKV